MERDLADLKTLIRNITSEVVGNMMRQPGGAEELGELCTSQNKSMLVLVPEFAADLGEFMNYLGKSYPEHEFVLGAEGTVEVSSLGKVCEAVDINEGPSRKKLYGMINRFDGVILISPGVMQLKAITEGDDSGFMERIMINQALHGRQAAVLLDYSVKDMASNSLTKRIKELVESVKNTGISVNIINEQIHQEKKSSIEKGKRLITEKDIEDMFKKGTKTIQIGQDCIITPMARDKANELKIEVII